MHACDGRHEGVGASGRAQQGARGVGKHIRDRRAMGDSYGGAVVEGKGAVPGEIQRGEKVPDCAVVGSPRAQAWALKEARQVNNYSPGYMEQTPSRGHKASP